MKPTNLNYIHDLTELFFSSQHSADCFILTSTSAAERVQVIILSIACRQCNKYTYKHYTTTNKYSEKHQNDFVGVFCAIFLVALPSVFVS